MAALVVAAVVLAGRGGSNHASSNPGAGSAAPSTPVAIQDASVFHLERDADDAVDVRKAFDGNPNTVWQTDHYFSGHWAGLRHGLGLAVTLGGQHTLRTLTVTSPTVGWSAEVYVSDTIPQPPTLAPWGPPTDSKQGIDGSATFTLGGRSGSTVLLWITDPGPANQAAVAELVVR